MSYPRPMWIAALNSDAPVVAADTNEEAGRVQPLR
jgi:hypothetical protein